MKKIIPALGRGFGHLSRFAAHPFSRWERLYSAENPWRFDRPSEIHRFEETNRIIRDRIGPVGTVLEIGAGEGDQTEWLLKLAGKAHGLDISPTAIERARHKFANNPNASFAVGKLPDIRAADRFDLVTAFEIIYYVKPLPPVFDLMERLGKTRMVSVHWPKAHLLDEFLFSTRNASREIISWDGKPAWLVAWW